MSRKIAFACDHVPYPMHQEIIGYIKAAGDNIEVLYMGPDHGDPVDYPDYARLVAEAVAKGEAEKGILICGSGIGMSITANKFPGVRAAVCHDHVTAVLTREHNDANVLCAGVFVSGSFVLKDMIAAFLNTPYSDDEQHHCRVAKISAIEKEIAKS